METCDLDLWFEYCEVAATEEVAIEDAEYDAWLERLGDDFVAFYGPTTA